jgi:protein SCO1/2
LSSSEAWKHCIVAKSSLFSPYRTGAIVLCVAIQSGCDYGPSPFNAPGDPAVRPRPRVEPMALPEILTVPEFSLTNQHGETITDTSLQGDVWVANFIFTRCIRTCPEQTKRMVEIQEALKTRPVWPHVRLVSFSVDPEHDTPEVLAAYAQAHHADPEHWHFLTGSRDAIWKLSKDGFHLGVGENRAEVPSPIFHSAQVVLVDTDGKVRRYFDGILPEKVADIVMAVELIAQKSLGSSLGPGDSGT